MCNLSLDQIVSALSARTQHVLLTAVGADRHQRLEGRLAQLYGALELARTLDEVRLAHRIETLINTLRRQIEID
jgi:hypothetical protein